MAKWADYLISGVRRDANGVTLQLRVHQDAHEGFGPAQAWPRQDVVTAITNRRQTFVTIYLANGKYVRGEDVRVVHVMGVPYLRTDANETARDNLDKLPEF